MKKAVINVSKTRLQGYVKAYKIEQLQAMHDLSPDDMSEG